MKKAVRLWCFVMMISVSSFSQVNHGNSSLVKPLSVYVNWAAYDELSDTVKLTEDLAFKQLQDISRLKKQGIQFDYFMMDAFWFDINGSYRLWRKPDWPNGFEAWLKACSKAGVKPGLWFSVNYIYPGGKYILNAVDTAWKSSLSIDGKGLCLFDGGYLHHFMETLDYYAKKGFRMFKFDFFDMNAVTPRLAGKLTKDEIKQANFKALQDALKQFGTKHPEVLLIGYNGFGGEMSNTGVPITQTIDKGWLKVFHTMYCGDPRPADVPAANFWRSKDIYSDHMVHYFMANGFPLKQIDNAGFMIGNTGTCYYRNKAAWKGMLLMSLSRGGWMNTYYGDLSLLTNTEAKWFAKAQRMWYPFQQHGRISVFGGLPGKAEPYGYLASNKDGALITVVNPSPVHQTIKLPANQYGKHHLLFSDSGYKPMLLSDDITLGPEQVAVVGYGSYASDNFNLGFGENIQIAQEVLPVEVSFSQTGNSLSGIFRASENLTIRLMFQQFDEKGIPFRSTGGSPPNGISLGQILTIEATQDGKELPVTFQYDKAIWSGLSWAVAEINPKNFDVTKPIKIVFTSTEKRTLTLMGKVFLVNY